MPGLRRPTTRAAQIQRVHMREIRSAGRGPSSVSNKILDRGGYPTEYKRVMLFRVGEKVNKEFAPDAVRFRTIQAAPRSLRTDVRCLRSSGDLLQQRNGMRCNTRYARAWNARPHNVDRIGIDFDSSGHLAPCLASKDSASATTSRLPIRAHPSSTTVSQSVTPPSRGPKSIPTMRSPAWRPEVTD